MVGSKEKKQDEVSLSPIFTPSRYTYPPWNVTPPPRVAVSSSSVRGSQKAQPSFRFEPERPPRTANRSAGQRGPNEGGRGTDEWKEETGEEKRDRAREKRNERSALARLPPCIYGHISGRPLQDNGFSRGPIKIIQMTGPAVNSIRESPCHRALRYASAHAPHGFRCTRFCIGLDIRETKV